MMTRSLRDNINFLKEKIALSIKELKKLEELETRLEEKEAVDDLNKYELKEKVYSLTNEQLEELLEQIKELKGERLACDVGKVFKDPDDIYFVYYYLCTGVVKGNKVGIQFTVDPSNPHYIELQEEGRIPSDCVVANSIDLTVGKLIASVVLPFAEYMNKWSFDYSDSKGAE